MEDRLNDHAILYIVHVYRDTIYRRNKLRIYQQFISWRKNPQEVIMEMSSILKLYL